MPQTQTRTPASAFMAQFPTEGAAREYIESIRWGKRHKCPYCTAVNRQTLWKPRSGNYQCKDCRKVYSVRIGTIFEGSKIGLRKWLHLTHLLQTKREDVSALQLSKETKVSFDTTWLMLHRLRECFEDESVESVRANGTAENGEVYTINPRQQHKTIVRKIVNHQPPVLDCILKKSDFVHFLKSVPPESVDLVLTDPPYNISRKTGFASLGANSVERFAVSMDFGEWDHAEISIDQLAKSAYRALRKGGTAIVFYDIWKLTTLAEALTAAGFVQLRIIEWIKTNPVPLNSKRNYLTNSREIAVLAVKGSKPTFNSEYDNGQYHYPIPNNGTRYHPTQKPLPLFVDLVTKHSKPGDLVIDPFVGSGTTALAAITEGRKFAGCDVDSEYIETAKQRVKDAAIQTRIIP